MEQKKNPNSVRQKRTKESKQPKNAQQQLLIPEETPADSVVMFKSGDAEEVDRRTKRTPEGDDPDNQISYVGLDRLDAVRGVVTQDVVTRSGAVLIPRGAELSTLTASIKNIRERLSNEGIYSIPVHPLPRFSDSELALISQKIASATQHTTVDAQMAQESIGQVRNLFEQSVQGERLTPENILPLANVARTLAGELTQKPHVALSLGMVKNVDEYTFIHSFNVAFLAGYLAMTLHPGDREFMEKVVTGGLLHDMGKSKIPLEILNKPGRLDKDEFEIMKRHSMYGLSSALSAGIRDSDILGIIGSHHEKWAGTGYPMGHRRNEIPEAARITAVADVFDALTARRVYKDPMASRDALRLILSDTGTHFDPKITRKLLTSMGLYPPGSIVELSDGSIGTVITSGGEDLVRPVVLLQQDNEGRPLEDILFADIKTSELSIRNYITSVEKQHSY